MADFFDIALSYDAEARGCDLVLGADGDLVIDDTAITPMLLSVGLDRRADDDDTLPDGRTDWLVPSSLSLRRGCAADALDMAGERTGSKLWLLNRAKKSEATKLMCEYWLQQSLDWVRTDFGTSAEIEVAWLSDGPAARLGYRVNVAGNTVEQALRVV